MAMVCPTKSGVMVERRDQVLITFLSPPWFMPWTFLFRCWSTKGPFFRERAILFLFSPLDDQTVGRFSPSGLVPFSVDSPGRTGMPAGSFAFAAAHDVVDRVLSHPSDSGTASQPAGDSGLA